jgi:hypothetical protein
MSRVLIRRMERLERAIEDGKPAEPGFVLIPKALPGCPEWDAEVKSFKDLHEGAPLVIVKVVSGRKDGSLALSGAPVTA